MGQMFGPNRLYVGAKYYYADANLPLSASRETSNLIFPAGLISTSKVRDEVTFKTKLEIGYVAVGDESAEMDFSKFDVPSSESIDEDFERSGGSHFLVEVSAGSATESDSWEATLYYRALNLSATSVEDPTGDAIKMGRITEKEGGMRLSWAF